nr:RNA-directed DNA polymerase, eukaryota [Tanacetum cinerariifolium]
MAINPKSMAINPKSIGSTTSLNSHRSKEDLTQKISKSFFVTNFPDHISARDLWRTCKAYGTVVDVYIPYKKSKAGKRFAFVRFIKVKNFNRLVANLCTIWIGSYHLQANIVRYQRERKTYDSKNSFKRNVEISSDSFKGNVGNYFDSFASVLKSGKPVTETTGREVPSLVLDDTCLSDRDFNFSLMGKVKDITALPNLYVILEEEGWDPLLRNEDYASSSSDEENEQENGGSRNEEKYEFDKEVNKVSESSCFTPKETSVSEVHEKEMEAPSEEVKQNSYNSVRNNSLNASYCSQRFKAGGAIIDLMDEFVKKKNGTYRAGHNQQVVRWDGECVIMGDFNEVRSEHERYGSVFNVQNAAAFNNFISLASLIDLPLDGYAYTWSYIQSKLSDIDKIINQGGSNEVILNDRSILFKELYVIISLDLEEMAKKAKVRWAIEGDENSKYFHGILNNKRSHLAIRGVLVNCDWIVKPNDVKNEFLNHFFLNSIGLSLIEFVYLMCSIISFRYDLERTVSIEEIKRVVWDCGTNKYPGPDGFTFEFFRRYWKFLENDISVAVMEFFFSGLFTGISLDNSLTISHLFYADDAIFFGKWDSSNLKIILKVLKCFHMASRLKININKSELMGYGVHSDEVETTARYIGCATFVAPFSHLGVKVGSRMERINSWDDVVSKVTSRLSKWKLKTLFIGGRLTLIKSVLTTVPLYQMSSFKVPIKVLNILESIKRKFFNGIEGNERKLALISWDTALALKKYGGLGVSSFFAISRALLSKWVWRFLSQTSSLWTRTIKAIHGEKENLGSHGNITRCSPWLDIVRGINVFRFKAKHAFLRISGVILPNMRDRWIWSFEASGDFSVTSARRLIDDYLLPKGDVQTRWVKAVPIKINVFAWRVRLDKLPTRSNPSLRGVEISSIMCPLCNSSVESASHVFYVSCGVSYLEESLAMVGSR